MQETTKKVGVCRSKKCGYVTLFHLVKVKLSEKYRVWLMPGMDKSTLLDPDEYMQGWETIADERVRVAA